MTLDVHRVQLSDFLKSCRRRLSAADVGLPDSTRRRRPGLRREDVAALAKVSITWYSWLEQGRDVQASAKMLEGLSRVLRLSDEEREYLFLLAQNRPAPLRPSPAPVVSPAVQRMLDGLSVPAYVMTKRWDVVAWNRIAAQTLRDYGAMPPEERNLLKILLTGPTYQADQEEYSRMAHRVVSKLRIDYGHAAGDPRFDELIRELEERCPIFRSIWNGPEITGHSQGCQVLHHPVWGDIVLEHTSYVVEGAANLQVIIHVPVGAESVAKIDAIARGATAPSQPEMASLARA